jgi:hypothetical protein
MSIRSILLLLSVLSLALLPSCRGDDAPHEEESGPAAGLDATSPSFAIFQILRASGSRVQVVGDTARPFFTPKGKILQVDGRIIQLYEYPSKEELEGEASKVGPDGSTIGGKAMNWKVPVHFYKTDKVIVLFEGKDSTMEHTLEQTLGREFAGG